MNITNVTEYDNITSSNYTDYDNMLLSNCTKSENNIDIIIPYLLLTLPCGLSFLCLMRWMVYTLIKPLFNKEIYVYKGRKFYTQIILLGVL